MGNRAIRSARGRLKIRKTMREFKQGRLRSGSGGKVRSRRQAIAIALSQARRERK